MSLVKITDLASQLDISSRSLRYYEQVGLFQSVRPPFEKYRYYDADTAQRLSEPSSNEEGFLCEREPDLTASTRSVLLP